ncbi:hypothetical protein P8610_04775 [Fictibacillus sp. UD]|uniref:hypothetical protein n=1 Tax=Fictibacillus sp. UD TaxID=3038777 RepID=UPI003745E687
MKKRTELKISLALLIVFIVLHLSPQLALRTHVFVMGYPIKAIVTEIEEDKLVSKDDQEEFERANKKVYLLTDPPIEKATQGELRRYTVKKVWLFYFAEFLGEG